MAPFNAAQAPNQADFHSAVLGTEHKAAGAPRSTALGSTCPSALYLEFYRLTASDAELVVAFLALAAGELSEDEIADWFRERR